MQELEDICDDPQIVEQDNVFKLQCSDEEGSKAVCPIDTTENRGGVRIAGNGVSAGRTKLQMDCFTEEEAKEKIVDKLL